MSSEFKKLNDEMLSIAGMREVPLGTPQNKDFALGVCFGILTALDAHLTNEQRKLIASIKPTTIFEITK